MSVGACVASTDKSADIDGRQTKKHIFFRLTAVNDGTCVATTDNDGRQTSSKKVLVLVKKVAMALLIYLFFVVT